MRRVVLICYTSAIVATVNNEVSHGLGDGFQPEGHPGLIAAKGSNLRSCVGTSTILRGSIANHVKQQSGRSLATSYDIMLSVDQTVSGANWWSKDKCGSTIERNRTVAATQTTYGLPGLIMLESWAHNNKYKRDCILAGLDVCQKPGSTCNLTDTYWIAGKQYCFYSFADHNKYKPANKQCNWHHHHNKVSATPRPNQSQKASKSPTGTASATATRNPFSTHTSTGSASASGSATGSSISTASPSASGSATGSSSSTASPSASASNSAQSTATSSGSALSTPTSSTSAQATDTARATATASSSASPTHSALASVTATMSSASTPTSAATETSSASSTPSASGTSSSSSVPSGTATTSSSPTSSASGTSSASRSSLPTASASASSSGTAAATGTSLPTATSSGTSLPTATSTGSSSSSASALPTATSSGSSVPTGTSRPSGSSEATSSATASSTTTRTGAPSASASSSATASASSTAASTATSVATGTAAATSTSTSSRSAVPTSSATSSRSALPTASAASSSTASATATTPRRRRGNVYCWGDASQGQLGTGTNTPKYDQPQDPIIIDENLVQIDMGTTHTCGLAADGTAWCWGQNNKGNLGDGTKTNRPIPVIAGNARAPYSNITTGEDFTVAIDTSGRLWGWGLQDSECQLAQGSSGAGEYVNPVRIPVSTCATNLASTKFVRVESGRGHTLAITCPSSTGGVRAIYAWGSGNYGQLGDGDDQDRCCPVRVDASAIFTTGTTECWSTVDAGRLHSCGITCAGRLYCWGDNSYGQLGDGTTFDRDTPRAVRGVENTSPTNTLWVSVAAGFDHTCAITTTGLIACWGRNQQGQLGLGFTGLPVVAPYLVKQGNLVPSTRTGRPAAGFGTTWTSVDAGDSYSCATTNTGEPFCWGLDNQGRTGTGATSSSTCIDDCDTPSPVKQSLIENSPVPIADLFFNYISTGLSSTCAFTQVGGLVPLPVDCGSSVLPANIYSLVAGSAFCFGSNAFGETGSGGNNGRGVVSFPTYPVTGSLAWNQVVPGHGFACGITGAGGSRLACWGSGRLGQLGTGQPWESDTPVPVVVNNVTAWQSVASALDAAAAISSDGRLWSWGLDMGGKLGRPASPLFGINAPGQVNVPGKIFATVWATYDHFLALATDGTLYAWGSGQFGRLGTGSSTITAAPALVALPNALQTAGDSWATCSAGGLHSACVTTGGRLVTWGQQSRGRLGNGQVEAGAVAVPTVVGIRADWVAVSAGADHTLAMTASGDLFAFGDNAYGQLGVGTQSSDPTAADSFRAVPTLVAGGYMWTSAAAGARFSMGTDSDGLFLTWGGPADISIGRGDAEGIVPFPVPVSTHLLPVPVTWGAVAASAEGLCALVAYAPPTVISAGVDDGVPDSTTPSGCAATGGQWNASLALCQPGPVCDDPELSFDGFSCEPAFTAVLCADDNEVWNGAACVSLLEIRPSIAPLPTPVPIAVGQSVLVPVTLSFAGLQPTAFNTTQAQLIVRTALAQTLTAATGQTIDAANIIIIRIYIEYVPADSAGPTARRRQLQVAGMVPVVRMEIALNTTSMAVANLAYTAIAAANSSDAAGSAFAGPLLQFLAAADPVAFGDVGLLSISAEVPRVVTIGASPSPVPIGAASTSTNSLAGGAIAGVVIAVVVGTLLLVAAWATYRKSKGLPLLPTSGPASPGEQDNQSTTRSADTGAEFSQVNPLPAATVRYSVGRGPRKSTAMSSPPTPVQTAQV